MAISKTRKEELVQTYVDLIERSDAIFVTKYTGMTVKQIEGLRQMVREKDGSLHVTKNTLLRIALEQTGMPIPHDLLNGQVAALFSLGQAPSLAKSLLDYAKKDDIFELKGAVFGPSILDSDGIETLSKMPTLDEVRAKLLGLVSGKPLTGKFVRLISTPQQDVVNIMNNSVGQVINVINAYAQKSEGEGEG
ncbi:MAG: 50S ribosomal protein L10 [Chloroflexota bacterium]